MRRRNFARRKKQSVVSIIVNLILILGIGYAIIQSNLNINGTANMGAPTWNIHWKNVQVKEGSVTGDNVVTAPTIDADLTTVNYSVILNTPGDYYEFTVDAVNSGSINGIIENVDYSVWKKIDKDQKIKMKYKLLSLLNNEINRRDN